MQPFATTSATDAEGAVATVASDPGARFVAGGTTLVDLMKLRVETPGLLVDVTRLPLGEVLVAADGGLRVGATVRNSALARHPEVVRRWPVVSEALLAGASPQLRNMATVAGNLLQRTRCTYFRDTGAACNKREPGSGCSALEGNHRNCAVLGTSDDCIATFPGDMPVAMACVEATVHTRRADGSTRIVPAVDLHVPYGDDPARETVLEHGELVEAVHLPDLAWLARSAYVKVRDRASYEFALASAAVALDLEPLAAGSGPAGNGIGAGEPTPRVIREARIALGGVASKPWRATAAEELLRGAEATPETLRAAAAAAFEGAVPRRDTAFKVELGQRTVRTALDRALALPDPEGAAL